MLNFTVQFTVAQIAILTQIVSGAQYSYYEFGRQSHVRHNHRCLPGMLGYVEYSANYYSVYAREKRMEDDTYVNITGEYAGEAMYYTDSNGAEGGDVAMYDKYKAYAEEGIHIDYLEEAGMLTNHHLDVEKVKAFLEGYKA